MSERHPIIAITGSSGAGTTSVTRTYQNIFRREKVRSVIIEGDSYHRYDRKEMKVRQAEAEKAGNKNISQLGPDTNMFPELEALFADYARTVSGIARIYLHDTEEAAAFGEDPGTFTPWEYLPKVSVLLFYDWLHV